MPKNTLMVVTSSDQSKNKMQYDFAKFIKINVIIICGMNVNPRNLK
jgi:hypothetical protein